MERMIETDKLPAYALAMYIQGENPPLVIYLTEPVVLGRAGAITQQMHLDLSPYNAAEMGVSRQHALFRRGDNVTIEDMSSTNGTWLNGSLLQPYQPAVLHSGDDLRLARLEMEVYIPE